MRMTRLGSHGAAALPAALLLLALALLDPAPASAQWATPTPPGSPNDIVNTNTGNVGVGNPTPRYKLDVVSSPDNAQIRFGLDSSNSGGFLFSIGTSHAAFGSGGTWSGGAWNAYAMNTSSVAADNGTIRFFANTGLPQGVFTPTERMRIAAFGYVGIGTASPANGLHVHNASGFQAVRVSGAGGGLMNFLDTSAPANQKFYQWRSEGGVFRMALVNDAENAFVQQNLLVANSAGNVGFGTASPTARLHVQGGNVFHQYSTTAGQEYGFYTAINNNHVTSNLAFDGQWKMIAAGKGAIANVAPASGFAFLVGADNTSRAAGALSTITQYFTVMMDGKVGIGNTAPTYKLDVAGQVRSSSGGFVFPDGSVQTTAAAGGGGTLTGVTAGDGLIGGGTTGSVTLNVGAGTGLSVAPDSLSVNYGSAAGTAVQGNTQLTLTAGAGMSGGGTSTLGTGGTLTLTNADRGSAQNIFKNVANAAGVTQFSAGTNNDAVSFEGTGGTTISFNAAAKKITINSSASAASGWTEAAGGATLSPTNPAANVGIGTATPTRSLEVSRNVTGNFDGLFIYNNAGAPHNYTDSASLSLGRSPNHVMGQITASNKVTGTYGDGYLAFSTRRAEVVSERVRIDQEGNVGIGTAQPGAKLHVEGGAYINGDLTATGNIAAKYQDVAEWVPSVQKLSAGTVVVLDSGRTNHVLASSMAYDTKVAGVVSEQPGVILGIRGEGKLMVATTGRVRVRVDATRVPIRIGDLIVTSDVEGLAMRSEPVMLGGRQMHAPGTIIGKALEPLEQGTGEILVLLSLQ
jgi:hypothetical protein